ncbi:MAG: hypothetical protein IIB66_09055 [Proteobacteria bacterium]|nr:hypothetical protein [Pseudomonadota bacterium]
MVGKTAGFLAAIAVLCLGQFAGAAQAGDTNFLKAGSPLEAGALIKARPGVGVEPNGGSDEERRRRRLAGQPPGSVSGAATPLTRTGNLPATRAPSRAAGFQASPALVGAVRNELSRIGLK